MLTVACLWSSVLTLWLTISRLCSSVLALHRLLAILLRRSAILTLHRLCRSAVLLLRLSRVCLTSILALHRLCRSAVLWLSRSAVLLLRHTIWHSISVYSVTTIIVRLINCITILR